MSKKVNIWTDAATPDGATVTRKAPLEYVDELAFHRRAGGRANHGA